MTEFQKLKTFVNDYKRTDNGIIIEWKCKYEDEETLISSPAIPIVEKRLPNDYITLAFKASKKDIKTWFRSVKDIKPAIIGTQFIFAPEDIAD